MDVGGRLTTFQQNQEILQSTAAYLCLRSTSKSKLTASKGRLILSKLNKFQKRLKHLFSQVNLGDTFDFSNLAA